MKKPTERIDSKTSQSFERFERLAKALVAVPKKELDKELAKYERKKERRKIKKTGDSL
jgi:hypothetical protein